MVKEHFSRTKFVLAAHSRHPCQQHFNVTTQAKMYVQLSRESMTLLTAACCLYVVLCFLVLLLVAGSWLCNGILTSTPTTKRKPRRGFRKLARLTTALCLLVKMTAWSSWNRRHEMQHFCCSECKLCTKLLAAFLLIRIHHLEAGGLITSGTPLGHHSDAHVLCIAQLLVCDL